MPDLKESVDAIVAAMPGAKGPEDVINFLKKASEMLALMPGAPEGGAMPTPEEMSGMELEMKKTMEMSQRFRAVAEELGVEDDKVLPTVAAFKAKADGATDAEKEIAELRAFKAESEIRMLIEDKSEFIPPAKRDEVKTFASKHGIEAAKTMIATAFTTKIPNSVKTPPEPEKKDNNTPSPEFVKFRKAKGRTDEQILTEWKALPENNQKEA